MRFKIWHEDDFFQFGDQRLDMDADVVRISDPLPLSWMYHHEPKSLLGSIGDIMIEDGAITGDITWTTDQMNDDTFEDYQMHSMARLGGYYKDVIKNEEGNRVTSCTLVAVSVIINPQNPLTREEQLA